MTYEKLLVLYRRMLLIRRLEERIAALYSEGVISGTCHLCIGQEAVAVGVGEALELGDQVVSCHRGHGHLLAMGGQPAPLLGELMGRQNGYCRGRGGSQHLSAPKIGFLGTNGITGGGIPIATGAALSAKLMHTGAAVVCFFGDGATNQGTFHESLNMAALWKLPILYVCENNCYAMSEPVCRTIAGGDIQSRPRAYGIPTERVDGMDVEAIEQAARRVLADVRIGKGPAFIEAMTYRFCGHSKSDKMVYRTREEEAQWKERDPLATLRARLEQGGHASGLHLLEQEVRDELSKAEDEAKRAAVTPSESALQGVYADA